MCIICSKLHSNYYVNFPRLVIDIIIIIIIIIIIKAVKGMTTKSNALKMQGVRFCFYRYRHRKIHSNSKEITYLGVKTSNARSHEIEIMNRNRKGRYAISTRNDIFFG